MQNKIFFTHAFFLLYGLATHAYAIDERWIRKFEQHL